MAANEPLDDGRRAQLRPVPANGGGTNRGGTNAGRRGPSPADDPRPTDEDLLEAFYRGNDEALDRLVERYRWLTYYVYRRLPPRACCLAEWAEDICQITWIKVMNTRTTQHTRWVRSGGRVLPWLVVIADNTVRDEARKAARDLERAPERDEADSRQEAKYEQHDLHAAVVPFLALLDPQLQRLVLMKYWVGMSQSEIAEELGLSEPTVSRRLAAARTQLRAWLLTSLGDEDL